MNIFNRACIALMLVLSFHVNCGAQLKWKNYILAGSAMLVSGMIDGTVESINYHYEDGFKLRCPKANNQFWNPAISWKNKYKNNDPAQGPKFIGSDNVLVFTTDAYHMLRSINRTINGVTLVYYIHQSCVEKTMTRKKKWIRAAEDFLILTAIRTAGFQLTYSLVFRKQ
jgi:hypothetical protein